MTATIWVLIIGKEILGKVQRKIVKRLIFGWRVRCSWHAFLHLFELDPIVVGQFVGRSWACIVWVGRRVWWSCHPKGRVTEFRGTLDSDGRRGESTGRSVYFAVGVVVLVFPGMVTFETWFVFDPAFGRILLGLEYKSRGFSRKLRPGKLLHGHNSVNSQQILMGLQGTLPISLDRVYPKYQNDWWRNDRVMALKSLPCLLFQCVLYLRPKSIWKIPYSSFLILFSQLLLRWWALNNSVPPPRFITCYLSQVYSGNSFFPRTFFISRLLWISFSW